jgi:probable HAF family extracellular repeat protein
MKSRLSNCIAVITVFAAAISVQLTAQEQQQNKQDIRYTVTDLGLASPGGISNNGSLAYNATLPDGPIHATFLRHGRKTDLGTLGGPNSSVVFGPSERGQVVGFADTSIPDPLGEDYFACGFGTHLICRGFVWQMGQMTPLSTLGGNNSAAEDINNRGEVVGVAELTTKDPTCQPPQVLQSHAVIWEKGQIRELPTFGEDPEGAALAINDSGVAVGVTGDCATSASHAVLWRKDGSVQDLGNLGGTSYNTASGINNQGQVVGASNVTGGTANTNHAFLWTEEDGMRDLGTLPGDSTSGAYSINDNKQVVGVSADTAGDLHAFVWQDGVMADLNKVIPPSLPFVLIVGFDINDHGEITVQAIDLNTDESHALLLTPCGGNHADSKGCTDEDAAAIQGGSSERPKVVLSERARKLLWQHLRFLYRIPTPPGVAAQSAAESAPEQALSKNVAAAPLVDPTPTTLQISPTSLNFGFVATSATERVNLQDVSTTTLHFSGITISGTNASDFAQTHNCKASLPAGASCQVSVTAKPKGTGTRTAALTITDNAEGSPQKVPLTCVGCIPDGAICYGPAGNHCCPPPWPHHSGCSNPKGWGTCFAF